MDSDDAVFLTDLSIDDKIFDLSLQITILESKLLSSPHALPPPPSQKGAPVLNKELQRVQNDIVLKQIYSIKYIWCMDANYYNETLEYRINYLSPSSNLNINRLWKSMLLENKNHSPTPSHPNNLNPKFLLLLLPYTYSISINKLHTIVHGFLPVKDRLKPNCYNFKVASAEDNLRITGFEYNSVCPVGMASGEGVPILTESSLLGEVNSVFLGGGDVSLKICISVRELIEKVVLPSGGVGCEFGEKRRGGVGSGDV